MWLYSRHYFVLFFASSIINKNDSPRVLGRFYEGFSVIVGLIKSRSKNTKAVRLMALILDSRTMLYSHWRILHGAVSVDAYSKNKTIFIALSDVIRKQTTKIVNIIQHPR